MKDGEKIFISVRNATRSSHSLIGVSRIVADVVITLKIGWIIADWRIVYSMFDDKIEKSRKVLRLAAEMSQTYYGKPLIVTYSGGKDSDVLLHLAETTLTPDQFEVLNSHTTVDAPVTVYHIRENFERLNRGGVTTTIRQERYKTVDGDNYSEYRKSLNGKPITMWNLIPLKRIPPTRIARYCCSVLKESGTPNRMAAVGVRAAESTKRQGRDTFSTRGGCYAEAKFFSYDHAEEVHREALERDPVWDCTLIKTMREHGETIVNPIYEWLDTEIWQYVNDNKIKMNPLYYCGKDRVGCLFCPLAKRRDRLHDEIVFPRYKNAYIRSFDRMLIERKKAFEAKGKNYQPNELWKDGKGVFRWWMEDYKYNVKGQLSFDFSGNIKED